MATADKSPPRRGIRGFVLALVCAVGLTYVFWSPLYEGHGFVGGDVYSYYLPQKDVFAQSVNRGVFPMWNNRTGWGYPLIGESQTGVLYPFTWAFYLPLDLNTAYNANHLTHYILAFLFAWLYARRLNLRTTPALLAAVVYVYGWFPPRCSLEWAIIGGTWLPAALWTTEGFLQTSRKPWLCGLAVVLAMQLLAGHFAIAFITLLTLTVYAPLRLWLVERDGADASARPAPGRAVLQLSCAIVIAFLLAAVQLLPTWELKAHSQRAEVTEEHNPEYGHMPPMYVSQLVASWWFLYAEDVDTDAQIRGMKFLASDARTNKTEAHLYFGLLPLGLMIISLFRGQLFRRDLSTVWAVIGFLFLLYTPGWLVPITQHLPGFSFFEGPARYGITTTLAAAMVAAMAVNGFVQWKPKFGNVVCIAIVAVTVCELRVVARQVAVARMVPTPPISLREQSPISRYFDNRGHNVRLFAPGANMPSLYGEAAMPIYLGLSPAEYFTPHLMLPPGPNFCGRGNGTPPSTEQITWLQRAGITHVLSEQRFQSDALVLVSDTPDVMLNAAWGRPMDEPIYLYELRDGRPRAYTDAGDVRIDTLSANAVVLEANMDKPGTVVLTDLMFPGWTVHAVKDGVVDLTAKPKPKQPNVPAETFRTVALPDAGRYLIHWKYQPNSVYFGAAVSGVAWLSLIVFAFWLRRRGSRA